MLTQRELNDLLDHLHVQDTGRKVVIQIRTSPPARRVQSGSCNVAARFPSRKMQRTIQAESHTNELARIIGWEYDPATHEFYDQPPRIRLEYEDMSGRKRSDPRTVDFFLIQSDFIGWAECKTENWLHEHVSKGGQLYRQDASGNWICPAGNEYAQVHGLGFQVLSASTINRTYSRNLLFLADFLTGDRMDLNPNVVNHFVDQIKASGHMPLRDLLNGASAEENDVLYRLIAQGDLYVDLERQPLAEPDNTKVFRSEAAAMAYFAVEAGRAAEPKRPKLSVSLAQDEVLNWDGRPWRILMVGTAETVLVDGAGRIARPQPGELADLVARGLMTSAIEAEASADDRVLKLMLAASDLDLKDALRRQRILSGQMLSGDKVPSKRMLAKWRRWARHGEKLYGQAFLGLIRHSSQRGNRTDRLDPATAELLQEALGRYAADQDGLTIHRAWGDLCLECEKRGLIPPSERTFQRKLKQIDRHDMKAAREGERAAYNLADYDDGPDWQPRHGDRPFQIAHIDHTQVDVQLVGRKFGEPMHKPWLTLLIDAYTRFVLAYVLTFDPPSYQSCMLVIRECLRRHRRMPQHIVSDGGKEFDSIYYESLLARLECTKKSRAASRPRYGAPVERWFGLSNQQFTHQLRGNNTPLQHPRRMSRSHDPRGRAVWTLPDLTAAFEGYLAAYHTHEHSTLGVSPEQAMKVGVHDAGARAHKLFPLTPALEIECLPSTAKGTAKVLPGRGVHIGVPFFTSPALKQPRWQGTYVDVRFDPLDASTAYAWLGDHWDRLQSEYAHVFAGRSVREIELLTQELRGKEKRSYARRRLNATHLAQALQTTKQSEAVLIQRQRDEALKSSQSSAQSILLPSNVTPLRPTGSGRETTPPVAQPPRLPKIKPLRSFE